MPTTPATLTPDNAPEWIGPFRVRRLLGRGSMGDVWLAHDPMLDREVAVKVLPHNHSLVGSAEDRMIREARAASALDHESIVQVYQLGHDGDLLFIAMEYVDGRNLKEALSVAGAMPREEVVLIVEQVAAGLDAAHAAGLVHRDVKPENIVVRPDGRAKILDFGLVHAFIKGDADSHAGKGESEDKGEGSSSPDVSRIDEVPDSAGSGDGSRDPVDLSATMSASNWGTAARAAADSVERTQQLPGLERSEPTANGISRREDGGDGGFTAAVGTPLYMAPEQIAGERPTPAADQYALAASAWEMLAGARMRSGDFNQVLLNAHAGGIPEPPDGFPRLAYDVLCRALAKAPADRFGSAGELAAALRNALLPGSGTKSTRRGLLLGALALVAVAGTGGALWWNLATRAPDEMLLAVTPGNKAILAPVYDPLAGYLSERLGHRIRVTVPESYDRVLEGLDDGRFHVALLSPVPYVNARRRIPDLVLLGGRYFEFTMPYHSVVVRRKGAADGPIPAAFKAKRFCFVDPKSTSGYLVPLALLLDNGFDPDLDAAEVRFSGDHYNVLRDLSEGKCDVGAVSALQLADAPRQAIPTDDLEVVLRSEPLPPLAVVAHPSLPEETLTALRDALFGPDAAPPVSGDLGLSEESGSFRPVDDAAYDVIRRIEARVAGRDKPPE